MKVDVDAASRSLTSVFQDPMEVVGHRGITRQQKIRILKQWEIDARGLAVAEAEGMIGGEPDMLQRVMHAIDELDAKPAKRGGAGTDRG